MAEIPFMSGAHKAAESLSELGKDDRAVLAQAAIQTRSGQLAAQAHADNMLVKQRISLKIHEWVGRIFGVTPRQEERFLDELTETLAGVPEEKLTEPRGSVVGPALEGVAYEMDDEALRAMYVKLIASATIEEAEATVHPGFANVLRQISREEVRALEAVLKTPSHPIKSFYLWKEGQTGRHLVEEHILHPMTRTILGAARTQCAAYVDNWQRLGLCSVNYMASYPDEAYDWPGDFQQDQIHDVIVVTRWGHFGIGPRDRVEYDKGVLTVTSFGRMFYETVVEARAVEAASGAGQDPHHGEHPERPSAGFGA